MRSALPLVLLVSLASVGVMAQPRFSHQMHPCAGVLARGADRASANAGISVWLGERTLHFEHWLDTYGNADGALTISVSLQGGTITVLETYAGPEVRCRCVFRITGEAAGLGPGRYRLRVVFDNRHAQTRSTIEEAEVTVPNVGAP